MNVNFGLFSPIDKIKAVNGKRLTHTEQAAARKRAYTQRAMNEFDIWLGTVTSQAAE